MSSENHSHFENDLATAGRPTEVEVGQNKQLNDPALSIQKGLTNLYYKYLAEVAKQKNGQIANDEDAEKLIARIDELSLKDLGYEASKFTPIERAKEIIGPEMFFGPEKVTKAFGIEISEQIPLIPFNQEELEIARGLNQFLVLRMNQTADGQPLTMQKIEQICQPESDRESSRRVLCLMYSEDWYRTQHFFTSETPNFEWALTSSCLIPHSTDVNYFEQIDILAEYLKNEAFAGLQLPNIYRDAITQYEKSIGEINRLRQSDLLTATQKFVDLSINQLTRPKPVEFLYDEIIYSQNESSLPDFLRQAYTWTSSRGDAGYPIYLGASGTQGVRINTDVPSHTRGASFLYQLGTIFSRRGSDLKL